MDICVEKKQYLNDNFAHFRALTHNNFDLWPKSLQFLDVCIIFISIFAS